MYLKFDIKNVVCKCFYDNSFMKNTEPLAYFLRPTTLDEVVWQEQTKVSIQKFLENWQVPSMIFWWSPWCWKTTIANVLSHQLQADFFELSWVKSKKEDLNTILEHAEKNKAYWKKTLLFLDEIHRRNKAQQDSLLPFVESGLITLIWATTENPSFTINNALLSRAKVIVFEALKPDDIIRFFHNNQEKIHSRYPNVEITEENLTTIANLSNWDLRNACNLLESSIMLSTDWKINDEIIKKAFGKPMYYDRDWEEHYNIISAIHKSLRDSDPHAACYRIQRMLSWWEDPRYIARRLLRFASEDIWLADNNALLLANQVYDAVEKIWMPECWIFLMQLAIYLAKAPKSNLCYKVDLATKQDVEKYWNLPVPMQIRNAPTKLMWELWYWKWYEYAHDHQENKQSDWTIKMNNQHFPDELKDRKYF